MLLRDVFGYKTRVRILLAVLLICTDSFRLEDFLMAFLFFFILRGVILSLFRICRAIFGGCAGIGKVFFWTDRPFIVLFLGGHFEPLGALLGYFGDLGGYEHFWGNYSHTQITFIL